MAKPALSASAKYSSRSHCDAGNVIRQRPFGGGQRRQWYPSVVVSERVGAIVVSAGDSTRMRGVDKAVALLAGVPLVARTVEVFEASPVVDEIVVVASNHNLADLAKLSGERGWRKVSAVRLGGPRRQDSVRLGLCMLGECEWVLVHDGARPLVSERLIVDGLAAARETGAAIAAVRPKDTMKQLRGDGRIGRTLNRERLVAVQTPQVFRRALLADAHDKIIRDVTDDAAMVERIGAEVIVYEGDYANIKVTTPEDLAVAQALLAGAEATGD